VTDWFEKANRMQRDVMRAQKAQFDAAQDMFDPAKFDPARPFDGMQEAGRKAAEANLEAWKAWAEFWGWE
jgi:hypothetical protein